jgi:hypothetical protein
MGLSPEQAREALREIEQTRQRSHELGVYRHGGPILLIWGVIWIVGFALSAVAPKHATVVWLALTLMGAAAGWLLSPGRGNLGQNLRYVASWMVFLLLLGGSWAILTPQTASQRAALPALLVAAAYAFAGIWWWQRYLWLGLALFAVTLFGFFFAPWFELWMAVLGGGGLILGGLWLRAA